MNEFLTAQHFLILMCGIGFGAVGLFFILIFIGFTKHNNALKNNQSERTTAGKYMSAVNKGKEQEAIRKIINEEIERRISETAETKETKE